MASRPILLVVACALVRSIDSRMGAQSAGVHAEKEAQLRSADSAGDIASRGGSPGGGSGRGALSAEERDSERADGKFSVLLAQRPQGKSFAGLWEFPGGKIEAGESPEQALARELREELGIETREADLRPLSFASHAYEKFHLLMPLYLCRYFTGEPQPQEGQKLAWVSGDILAADYALYRRNNEDARGGSNIGLYAETDAENYSAAIERGASAAESERECGVTPPKPRLAKLPQYPLLTADIPLIPPLLSALQNMSDSEQEY